jgi:hypothetical protein
MPADAEVHLAPQHSETPPPGVLLRDDMNDNFFSKTTQLQQYGKMVYPGTTGSAHNNGL